MDHVTEARLPRIGGVARPMQPGRLERPPHTLRLWNRSFMAVVMSPEPPIADWFAALDLQLAAAPGFFSGRPVVLDLAAISAEGDPHTAAIVLDGFEARGLRPVSVEGADPALLAGTPWALLPNRLAGRDFALEAPAAATPEAVPEQTLLLDRPVRSGQSVVFEGGDLTIIGSVASGAEVIAGGSVHIYGALRGRAIAGLRTGASARIFCRRLEAEMVGVDRLYRACDHWGAALHGRAVQVFCDRGALRLGALA